MSALPNFKASSFFRAARGCGALALAGAMVLPMSPAIAQNVVADAPAAAVAGSLPDDRVRENPVATSDEFAPHWSYNALKDTGNDQVLNFSGWDFNGDINSPKVFRLLCVRRARTPPVLAISDIIEYNDPEYSSQYQHGLLNGNVKIPANTLDTAKQYTVEVWGNNGYEGSDKLVTPVVGQAPEGRGTLLASQALNFNGSDGSQAADVPGAKAVQEDAPTFDVLYDGKNPLLYTFEGGTVHVKGSGFTKEWREKHGTVVIYIAATQDRPGNVEPSTSMLRFEEGKDFTIEDDGTFDAYLKIKPDILESYYPLKEYSPDTTLEKVRYEIGILAEPKGQPQSTIQDIWARKNVVAHQGLNAKDYHPGTFSPMFKYDALKNTTKDQELLIQGVGFNGDLAGSKGMMYLIREKSTGSPVLAMSDIEVLQYDKENYTNFLEGGFAFITIKIPANTLDPSKEYVIEARSDYGYVSQPN